MKRAISRQLEHVVLYGAAAILLWVVSAAQTFAGSPVLVDDFNDGTLDPQWLVAFDGNANGWTFSEAGTELIVTDIAGMTSYCNNFCPAWSNVRLTRPVPPMGDFHVDFDFSWDSNSTGAIIDAMQMVSVFLLGPGDTPFAWVSYVDAWGPGGFELPRQFANIAGSVFEGPHNLPLVGSASIDIDRVGNTVAILWGGNTILTGTAVQSLEKVRIEFSYFDEVGSTGGGVTCVGFPTCNVPEDPSTFGTESVDLIRVAAPAVRYVDGSATGINNGSSWTNAYTRLQDALADAAASGGAVDEIWVADGTYKPDQGTGITLGDRTASFQLLDGVALYGGFAGGETTLSQRNPAINVTVLSGDLVANDVPVACMQNSPDCDAFGAQCIAGSCIVRNNIAENSYHVVTGSGTDASAVVDGVTITAGNANGAKPLYDRGAGMFSSTGSPRVTNCTFAWNSADHGGGMFNQSSSPAVTNCRFSRNWANGAGMFNQNGSSPSVSNCVFEENVGEGASTCGAGMINYDQSSPSLTNCTFVKNSAECGGAILNYTNSNPTLTNCLFNGNFATENGGAIENSADSNAIITNCTFSGNSAANFGGAVFNNQNSHPVMTNCTLSGNSALLGGGVMNNLIANPAVTNCILWNNSDSGGMDESAQIHTASGTPLVNYSIVQGGWSGAGSNNSSANPLFADADGPDNVVGSADDNLRLMPGSPATDAGDNIALPADAADLDGDANTAEQIPFDLAGNSRRVDDPDVSDTGAGSAPIVDMGAYEFQANVLFVDASASGNDDGSSWADAYTTVQSALVAAGIGGSGITEIWVADGTYKPDQGGKETPGNRLSTFHLSDGLAIYGGFAGNEVILNQRNPEVNVTILSGDLLGNDGSNFANNGENSNHVVTANGADAASRLDGFTITAGNASPAGAHDNGAGLRIFGGSQAAIVNCRIFRNTSFKGGAGAHVAFSNPQLLGCTFEQNAANGDPTSAVGGGAVFDTSSPTISNCRFVGNSAQLRGGAIYVEDDSAIAILNCVFESNSAVNGGAINFGGSAVNLSIPSLTGCVFQSNTATAAGGALQILRTNLVTTACTFLSNSALNDGGAALVTEASPTFVGCVFRENTALAGGGALSSRNAANSVKLASCLFRQNQASAGGALRFEAGSTFTAVNCTFFANQTDPANSMSGGAIDLIGGSTLNLTNGLFSGNRGYLGADGGAIAMNSGGGTITNCTFSRNTVVSEGGGVFLANSASPTVRNSVFWENGDFQGMVSGSQIRVASGTPTVSYSLIQGGWSGMGSNNVNVDPAFVDMDGPDNVTGTPDDNLRVQAGSPVIDAGNTPVVPADTLDLDGDADTAERTPFDLASSLRVYDDPATADTGVPGSPVVDMGAYEYFTDCNNNSRPDECDVSCAGLAGACIIYSGCGSSGDCDWSGGGVDGIPDECNISSCGGDPDCEDCNLNFVPDACDITSATSLDVNPIDGVPDECVTSTGGCGNNDWTCGANWPPELGGGYPDNQNDPGAVPDLVPTVSNATLFLDEDVVVDGLRILDNGTLEVTQTGTAGNLTVAAPGGLLLEGRLTAGAGRIIDVSGGLMQVRGNGFYGAPPALLRSDETHQSRDRKGAGAAANDELQITNYQIGSSLLIGNRSAFGGVIDNPPQALGGPVCGNGICEDGETSCNCPTESTCGACLAPQDLIFSNCDPCSPGMCDIDTSCDIILTGTMALSASGSIMMDGLSAPEDQAVCPCCPCTIENTMACGGGFLRGAILPPPKFEADSGTRSDIAGDLTLQGTVDFYYGSNNNLNLAGNFDNRLTTPACFDWSTSGMTMVGLASREFEAAGRDLGNSLSGFYYGSDTNFSLGELEIAANRSVTLVNRRNNLVGPGACQEALYVHHLILRANATLTLSNTRIYYETLTQEPGAAIIPQGCEQSSEVAPCPDAEACGDGNACTVDACNAGTCENVPIASLAYGDTAYTGEGSVVDVDDILCVLDAFAGIFNNCPVERADLTPCNIAACTTDDDCAELGAPCVQGRCHLLDVDDILAVLDAFVGLPACPDPCGP